MARQVMEQHGAAMGADLPRSGATAWAARRGLHYGWVMVAITFLIVVLAAGVRSAPSVLIRPLEGEFRWSRGDISLALSLGLLIYGLGGPLSGRLTERIGIRRTVLGFIALSAAGVALSLLIARLWQVYLFWGVLVSLGTGGMSIVVSAAVANTWFAARRGLVTGLLGGGSSAGQLVFLPLLVWLTATWGWRTALTFLAAALGGVVLPLAAALVRSRPHDAGVAPYGAETAAGAAAVADERVTPLRRALATRDFWLLAGSFAVCGFTTTGLIGTHFLPHAVEHGYSEAQAAGILSVIGGMNVVGTIASGWLCDRHPPRRLLAAYYTLRALSLLALPYLTATTSLPLMSLFAVVFGFDYIATVPPTVLMTADRFGRRSVGAIFGWISFGHMAGGAAAVALAGVIHDVAGEYTLAIFLGGLLGLVAAALAFSVRPGRPAPPVAAEPGRTPSPA